MDPITDLPPIAVHYAGDPSPQMTTQPAHPPYAEMITAAISALKDRDGSSRQAISKYIEKNFINLPPTHSVLLTHHLKRLKNLGQLIIVKHSYMLPPRSGQFQPATLDFNAISNVGNVTDPNVANVGGLNLENSPSGLSKRKPGRPPKLKPVHGLGVVQNPMPNVQPFDANAHPPSYEPQFPYHVGVGQDLQIINGSSLDFQGNSVGGGSEPLFASLGLGDDGVAVPSPLPTENTPVVAKRGRGRPPKSSGGRPVKSKSGKGRRPPKSSGDGSGARVVVSGGGSQGKILGDVSGSGARVVVSGGGSQGEILGDVSGSGEGESEGVERPVKKSKRMSVMGGNGVRVKKGRGRPRRIGFGAVTVPLSGNLLLPRTRPKRVARSIAAAVNGGVGETVSGPKRPARKFTGKRVGRPSKGGRGTAVLVTDPRQLVVYQELKSKYELLQSKVKQVANMVRSSIDPHYGNAALWALQELEALAGGGVEVSNAPSHDQTQEPEP